MNDIIHYILYLETPKSHVGIENVVTLTCTCRTASLQITITISYDYDYDCYYLLLIIAFFFLFPELPSRLPAYSGTLQAHHSTSNTVACQIRTTLSRFGEWLAFATACAPVFSNAIPC